MARTGKSFFIRKIPRITYPNWVFHFLIVVGNSILGYFALNNFRMAKITGVKVVRSYDNEVFEREVLRLLNEGYEFHGQPFSSPQSESGQLIQVMIKHETVEQKSGS
jgi:hypothetical protein